MKPNGPSFSSIRIQNANYECVSEVKNQGCEVEDEIWLTVCNYSSARQADYLGVAAPVETREAEEAPIDKPSHSAALAALRVDEHGR